MKPKLGIFLNLGDSFKTYRQSGRDRHWFNNYLKYYPKAFGLPLVFSYAQEANPFPGHLQLFPNRSGLPRFFYTFILPFVYRRVIKSCQIVRVKQMLGVWPAIIAKLFWHRPYLATYGYDYTYFAKKEGHWLSLPFIKLTEFIGIKLADKVIVTNPEMRKKVARLIKPQKIVLLPNGVDTELFRPGPRQPSDFIELVSVGRLVYQKNFLTLIKAVAQLKSEKPIRLTIVGRGPLKQKLIDLARQAQVKLRLISSLAYEQMPGLFQSADIFVMASHHEGSPKALLEAMACGLPCVVADKDYSRFIITSQKDGLLVSNTATELGRAVRFLIKKPKLSSQLGLRARQTVSQKFNNQTIVQQEIKLLETIAHV
jgi:glycosyltransferase involved in cell wall biosynthesis